jgi:catechol 2,3-dioxygenase-like lactoylglutathione lyase family enzyme
MYKGVKGAQHVGMGVRDYGAMKEYYGKTLEMTKPYAEFPEVWNAMVEVFRTSYHKFAGIMFAQEAGGIVVELIAMSIPVPRPIRKDKRYGDIGVNKIAIAVSDVEKFFKDYGDKVNFASKPKSVTLTGWGEYHFVFGRDPEGNFIEFISGPKVETKDRFGGVRWLGIAVTDLDRSIEFYQKYVGFDTVVVKPHESFSGLVDEVSGAAGTKVRSCLLANSRGGGMLELYECMKPRGRSIPLNTYWGDFGYLEIAIETDDIHEMGNFCKKEGLDFLHNPCLAFEMGDKELWFMYIKDPDGIPVETVAEMSKAR